VSRELSKERPGARGPAAGGIDFLVRIAERIIRADPKSVTIVAPPAAWTVAVVAGIGHIVYPLLPVIDETAHQSGMRPERPKAIATVWPLPTARPEASPGGENSPLPGHAECSTRRRSHP